MKWVVDNGRWRKPTEERDAAIIELWLKLQNFAAVGKEFGLQRERIRQIVRQWQRRQARLAG
jgi:DNA-directed RNA polymerase sigma subunit (sigma70/sigma32)